MTDTQRTTSPLHPLLAERWSPRAMDATYVLDDEALGSLLEAARWAPSSSNTQPWRFLVGRRDDDVFRTIIGTLASGNVDWASQASVLLLVVAEREDAEGSVRRHAAWDAGQSIAHLTLQAGALGLHVRQMGGFSPDAAREAFTVPDRFEPLTVVAIGALDPPSASAPERARKPLEEIAFTDWATPLAL